MISIASDPPHRAMGDTPRRHARILPATARFDAGPHGVLYVRSPVPLGRYPDRITDRLHHWAARAPDRTFLAWRDATGGWAHLTYGLALMRVQRIAASLLDRRLSPDRPVLVLSGNSLEHALIALAAMYAGIPYAPIAPAYALVPRSFEQLASIWRSMTPGLVYAADGPAFARAIDAMPPGAEIVTSQPAAHLTSTPFAELEAGEATTAVEEAHQHVGPDTIAKILFTSGSTGLPKGVINTQRMLCANQEMLRTVLAFLADDPPVLCDWLPWNHTFGGNHNFGIVLYNGGSLYLDEGRPMPGRFETTVRNLRDVAPTAYFNVPKGYEMLLPALKDDPAFRAHFFSRLSMLFYAAAGLRQRTADEFDALALETCGEVIPWVTGLGATESAPFALCTGPQMTQTIKVGLPVPGVELKVVPVGSEYEVRLRGPNITPGFWRDAALTAASFDAEGYYKLGDAVAFANPAVPAEGFVFRGRLGEDFKLSTGTWVRFGPLRAKLVAHFGSLIQDVVIAGPNRDYLTALFFPNVEGCRDLLPPAERGREVLSVLRHDLVRAAFLERLRTFAGAHAGTATTIRWARILETPPSFDAREITDKGSVNQRAVLAHRASLVEEMYADARPADVLDAGLEPL